MIYLTEEHVLRIHEIETGLSRYESLRDPTQLAAAIGRPQQSAGLVDAFPTIHDKAAALFEAIAQYQPFVDGNKRAAVHGVYAFYGFNGLLFEDADDWRLFDLADRLGDPNQTVATAEIAQEFEKWVTPIPDPQEGAGD